MQQPESFRMDRFFELTARGTTPRTEILAGLATYLTMVYIVVVNPSILAATGIDPGAAFVATCLAAAIGSLLMGLRIQAGGRTGLTAVTVAALFLLTLFLAPLATSIPAFATAPALVFVACLMAKGLQDLAWEDTTEYLPAILTALAMPFTFSIATGIGLGFLSYALVKTMVGRAGEVHGAVWLLAALSAFKFAVS